MKLRLLLLAGSATLNVAFATAFILKPTLAPPSVRDFFQRGEAAPSPAPAPSRSANRSAPAAPLWSALATDDLAVLVGRLRAAGFPPTMVRAVVEAYLERQFIDRLRGITRGQQEQPYWKPDSSAFLGNSKLFEDINQAYRERSRVMRDLLGKDALAYGLMDPTELQRRQFGQLSQEKINQVQRISDDYAEMAAQIRAASQGILLAEDREKLAFLEKEKRADLAALLSPAELADFELRTSPVTSRLRTAMTVMDASEDEFRRVYEAHQPYSELLYPQGPTVFTSEMSDRRREAQNAINAQLKAALGEQRFAEYQRANNSEYQQLYRLGQRDGVPTEALVRAYDTRNSVATESQRLFNDSSLNTDQRKAALKALADKTRVDLLSILGPAAGPAHVEMNRWLRHVEQGGSISINPDGNMSYRSAPPSAPSIPPRP